MEKADITRIAPDHHHVHTEIMIDASAAHVWDVLTDFATMSSWSPSFKGITGDLVDGALVMTHFDMGEGIEDYTATLRVLAGVQFGWSEDYDGIRDNHIYRVEPIGETQTRFVQTDTFKGRADWSSTAELADLYLAQYLAFNRALKAECERRFIS